MTTHSIEIARHIDQQFKNHQQLGYGPLGVIRSAHISHSYTRLLALFEPWLQTGPIVKRFNLVGKERPIIIEWCHVFSSLNKLVSVSVAEQEDPRAQKIMVKLAFHFNAMNRYWLALAQELSATELYNLSPLTSTIAFSQFLEEVGKRNPLVFAFFMDFFGTPGNTRSINSMAEFLAELLDSDSSVSIVKQWQQDSLSNSVSYASVGTLKQHGFPFSGSYGTQLSDLSLGLLAKDFAKAFNLFQSFDDQFHTFYTGIDLFYRNDGYQFPNSRVDWLEV